MYENRTYRKKVNNTNLHSFQVSVKETDLHISAKKKLIKESTLLIKNYRETVEIYIKENPDFLSSFIPIPVKSTDPDIIKDMKINSEKAGVGPMASIAGVISEYVGKSLLKYSDEIIVENGGDIFLNVLEPVTVALYAGDSPLSSKIGIRISDINKNISICTSTGTFGHSHSMGSADAVCVLSEYSALADAAATSICNRVRNEADIQKSIDYGKQIDGLSGIIVILNEKIGIWGELEIVGL